MGVIMLNQETHYQTIGECLGQDHRRIDKLLADLCAMVGDSELERADHSMGDFDAALRRHIRIEEDLLFPLVESRFAWPVAMMKREHREIFGWTEELKDSLARLERGPASTALAELTQIFGQHHVKEEEILYPAIDRVLSADERRALLEQIARR
jgi:hemerythrin-like domain-containing protein